MSTSATFLGPIDQLPAEGADFSPNTASNADYCASMFSDSAIAFDVSHEGVYVTSNPQEAELFQEFELTSETGKEEPHLVWKDNAFELHLQDLVHRDSFSTLSDASEPEDCVRRFLEVFASSLDAPEIGHKGAKVPLIRWQAGDEGNSAQIQLLGVLLAEEEHFEVMCNSEDSQFGLIFEDTEIEAHGVREAITVLALLGITLGSVTNAEAGLFDKIREKKQAKIEAEMRQQAIQRARAQIRQQQIQQAQTGYQDVHNDAYANHTLLRSGSSDREIVVDVANQRAYLIIDNQVALHTAVSTARSGKETPRGTFKITQRVAEGKTSTIYGCDLPYWQRLDQSAIGLHVGDLPGYPASAGCIRLPATVAPTLFAATESGVSVRVTDNWDQRELQPDQAQSDIMVAQSFSRMNSDS